MKSKLAILLVLFVAFIIPHTTNADSYNGPLCPGTDSEPLGMYYRSYWQKDTSNTDQSNASPCKSISHINRFYLSGDLSKDVVLVRRPENCGKHGCEDMTFSLYDEGTDSGTDSIIAIPVVAAKKFLGIAGVIADKEGNSVNSEVGDPYPDTPNGMMYMYYPQASGNPYTFYDNSNLNRKSVLGTTKEFEDSFMYFASSTGVSVASDGTSIVGKSWQDDLVPVVNPVDLIDTTYVINRGTNGELIPQKILIVTYLSDGSKKFESIPMTTLKASNTSQSWWSGFWCFTKGFFGKSC